jgi:hypothetical protein
MIQRGEANLVAEARKVFQSSRVRGAKSLVPVGQLFVCVDLYTRKQFVHFKSNPGEYAPTNCTFVHLHPEGLPGLGVKDNFFNWQ